MKGFHLCLLLHILFLVCFSVDKLLVSLCLFLVIIVLFQFPVSSTSEVVQGGVLKAVRDKDLGDLQRVRTTANFLGFVLQDWAGAAALQRGRKQQFFLIHWHLC